MFFLGHTDLGLTECGIAQARRTAEYLKNIPVNAIYASDLSRAYETAKCTADVLKMPIIKNEKLREIYAGLWENVAFSDIIKRFNESYMLWLTDIWQARSDKGESVQAVQLRIVSTLIDIAKQHKDQTVFVFTHATPIRVFVAYCLKKLGTEMKTVPWATNASVTKTVFDGECFTLLEYSKDDFIGDLVTKLPDTV